MYLPIIEFFCLSRSKLTTILSRLNLWSQCDVNAHQKHEGLFMVRCAIWYHLYNLKNVKNYHGGVLILAKLQAEGN